MRLVTVNDWGRCRYERLAAALEVGNPYNGDRRFLEIKRRI